MYSATELEELLTRALPDALVAVQDTTGSGDHFDVVVVSPGFEGKTLVEQHQIVYSALQPALDEALHALGVKTYTPVAWQKARG